MTKDDLIMAHDNLQRELADYKRLNQKDKHELIKSNISKIRKIEESEREFERYDSINHEIGMAVNNPGTSDDEKWDKVNKILAEYWEESE